MKKILEYCILEGHSIEIVTEKVNKKIKEGWVPFEPPQGVNSQELNRLTGNYLPNNGFIQAMVKYEEEEPKKEIL